MAAQHDYIIDNSSGAAVRADINLLALAIAGRNWGPSAPATTYAYMTWADTTNAVLKRRNSANSGWILECTLDETFVLSRSSNTMLDISDKDKLLRATGSYTQTLDAAATLGDGWGIGLRVESGATLVLDPNGTEQVNGATTLSIVGPMSGWLKCNGTGFYTVGMAFDSAATQSANTVYAGPSSGSATAPAFRALVPADLSMTPIANSIGADVALNNVANYFDGPSVAQGTSGTWFVSGTVTVYDTAGSATFYAKLWDGTTVISSAIITAYGAVSLPMSISLSGYIASPAANLRISVRDITSTSGQIRFNATGNSKDSTITAIRIA